MYLKEFFMLSIKTLNLLTVINQNYSNFTKHIAISVEAHLNTDLNKKLTCFRQYY